MENQQVEIRLCYENNSKTIETGYIEGEFFITNSDKKYLTKYTTLITDSENITKLDKNFNI
ncbi:hypothetical protein [uncultured Clostridium sp.]|uniref:hypothetical protein n=1 Tax=uncultured Clostridium sp. TaxID=59620 RepID=UPI0026205571|nr:hypothetical protein [uncultured Clostridium sp.]